MPLGRLIGLEILKLHEENEKLAEGIARYENILSDVKEFRLPARDR